MRVDDKHYYAISSNDDDEYVSLAFQAGSNEIIEIYILKKLKK